ncbi:MAG: hypothetical protein O3C40_04820 [Planctomycetota bacterium]|nr:hypothetical protein [Planctomycetota bacterium]
MKLPMRTSLAAMLCAWFLTVQSGIRDDEFAASLPTGVQAVWDIGSA